MQACISERMKVVGFVVVVGFIVITSLLRSRKIVNNE
jgi:hypothetical protein